MFEGFRVEGFSAHAGTIQARHVVLSRLSKTPSG